MTSTQPDNVWSTALTWSASEMWDGISNNEMMSDELDNLLFQFPDGLVDSVVGGSISTESQNASQSLDCQPIEPSTSEGVIESREKTLQTVSNSVEACTTVESLFTFDKRTKIKKQETKRERRFVCTADGCGKSFAKKWNLQAHERLHSGHKPFECRIGCGERYMWISSLKSHERRKCNLLPASHRVQRKKRSVRRTVRSEVPIVPKVYGTQAPSNEDKLQFELELEHIIARY